jgi:hypothetical protein
MCNGNHFGVISVLKRAAATLKAHRALKAHTFTRAYRTTLAVSRDSTPFRPSVQNTLVPGRYEDRCSFFRISGGR